jgi:parvulin-like peptidyl-prolyl isomerase
MANTPPTQRRVRSAHESKSATVRAAAATPSRRQRSRWQREQEQHRLLLIAVGALAVVVAAIFVGGLVYDNVVQANSTVAQVGADNITTAQLLDEVRQRAQGLDKQAKQFGNSQSVVDYVNQQKHSLPDQALNDMVDRLLITQETARRGITVTSAEVDDKERGSVAAYQSASNPAPAPTEVPTAEGTPAVEAAPGATPVSAAPTAEPATPTVVPTLTQDVYAPALQSLLDANGMTESQLRQQLDEGLHRDKLRQAIGQEQAPDVQDQVHARQIVVATQDQANDLLSQLKGGADFAQLAQQNSTDAATKTKGGDMGWLSRTDPSPSKMVIDAIFGLQPGDFGDPIQDSSGFHIVQALEHDPNHTVDAAQLSAERQKAFNDWLTSRRSSQDIKLSLSQAQTNWILSRIGVRP